MDAPPNGLGSISEGDFMTSENYWIRRGVSRRRALTIAASGSTGLVALGLVGCGGDGDETSPDATTTGSTPSGDASVGPTETPKRGGVFRSASNVDNRALDPYSTSAATVKGLSTYVFSRLYRIKAERPGPTGATTMTPEPDAAESVEVSADGLAYTIRLKPNVKWHPPVNRNMTADDVVFSWERFNGKLPGTTPAVNSEKLTFVKNVVAVDERTVRFELSRKYGPFFSFLADPTTISLMPKETGTLFDPSKVMVGSGPWMFDSWEPNVRYKFKRHPEWHFGPDAPYFDSLEINIVPEYTQRLNNFLAGNLDSLGVDGLDYAKVKKDIPGVRSVMAANTSIYGVAFSRVSEKRANAPWTDVRVRRAVSMAINREEMYEAGYSTSELKAAGLTPPEIWGAYVPVAFPAAYVHPRDGAAKDFMKFDPTAAKKLLDEAGGGFSAEFHYSPAYGRVPTMAAELIVQYLDKIGIKLTAVPEDYASKFVPFTYRGEFDGLAMAGQGGFPDPGNFLEGYYGKDSQRNPSRVNDPKVEEFIQNYYNELDDKKRVEVIRAWQNYLYEQMYNVPTGMIGDSSVVAYQPAIRGPEDHVAGGYGYGGEATPYFWKA